MPALAEFQKQLDETLSCIYDEHEVITKKKVLKETAEYILGFNSFK